VLDATFVVFVCNQDRILTGDWGNRMSVGVGVEVSVSVGSSEWLSGKGFSVSVADQNCCLAAPLGPFPSCSVNP
jgi:hypothetical protein